MYQPLEILSLLADDTSEIAFDNDQAVFTRQGKDITLIIEKLPGIGYAVKSEGKSIPFLSFVQSGILGLPTLANQIIRSMQKRFKDRPAKYIEGPAIFYKKKTEEVKWDDTSKELKNSILKPIPFSTHLIELMAIAGQGKTVLLEQLALTLARDYQPDENPIPLLLPVDLLGRYIGTIDDAIAGTLNNTILFPLSQKDVVFCMGKGWIVLALDGFDELVARIGAREAFNKVKELIEQLKGCGTIIISARENFFLLHHIGAARQSYLQPKSGYTTSSLKLLPWGKPQGEQVFKNFGSTSPQDDYGSIVTEFLNDSNLLSNPFFLTKIAQLWSNGDRFKGVHEETDTQFRIKFVLEQYIWRESQEKWKTGHDLQMLSPSQHNHILGYIAEEMWKTDSFKLTLDELTLATELSFTTLELTSDVKDSVLKRIPTHAALQSSNGYYSFIHEQFFSFYFGHRLIEIVQSNSINDIARLILEKELLPCVLGWCCWNIKQIKLEANPIINFLISVKSFSSEPIFQINLSSILIVSLSALHPLSTTEIISFTFSANAFDNVPISYCKFVSCHFWDTSFENASISNCIFSDCSFDKLEISNQSIFKNVSFNNSLPKMLFTPEGDYFDPIIIENKLSKLGIIMPKADKIIEKSRPKVRDEAIQCVVKIVKWSNRFFNVAVEEILPQCSEICENIIEIGLEIGVFKNADIDASGSRKSFFRIVSPRDLLIEGQIKNVNDDRINKFWCKLASKYPNV